MNIPDKIRARRTELGLSDLEVAQLAGISIHQYADVEQHADEFTSVLTSLEAKQLCEVLHLNLAELIGVGPLVTDLSPHLSDQQIDRNLLISKRREELRISQHDLAESLGFEDGVIDQIERDPNYLNNWPIELIISLANELNLLPQTLLI